MTVGMIAMTGNWYVEYAAWIDSNRGKYPFPVACSLFAAMSPNQGIEGNKTVFKRFVADGIPRGLPCVKGNIQRALADKPLSGLKVQAFAQALAGDTQAVVIDRWMLRYLGYPQDRCSKKTYRQACSRIVTESRYSGLPPREYQAAVWERVRERGKQ